MWPAIALDEGGRTGDEQQFANLVRMARGDGQRQLGAERPAGQGAVRRQAGGNVIGRGVKVGNQRGAAIAWQVEKLAVQGVDRSIQRATADAPAGQENKGSGHDSSFNAVIS